LAAGISASIRGTVVANPGMRPVGDLGYDQKVVPAETIGAFPLVAVFVNAPERNIVARHFIHLVFPNGGFDGAQSYFVGWFFAVHVYLLFLLVLWALAQPRVEVLLLLSSQSRLN
jgi:hypothetical protein